MTQCGPNPSPAQVAVPSNNTDDAQLISALRAGDEAAFATLLERYHGMLVHLALTYVNNPAVAQDVAQETWLEVVRGIHRFEERSTLKTWICSILVNRARTRATREQRSVSFSALGDTQETSGTSGVDNERFDEAGWWSSAATTPQRWPLSPEERVLNGEAQSYVATAIATLPPNQRQVITLRDVHGWSAAEVCNVLGLSETNQRVMLHRARSRIRGILEVYFDEGRGSAARPTPP